MAGKEKIELSLQNLGAQVHIMTKPSYSDDQMQGFESKLSYVPMLSQELIHNVVCKQKHRLDITQTHSIGMYTNSMYGIE